MAKRQSDTAAETAMVPAIEGSPPGFLEGSPSPS